MEKPSIETVAVVGTGVIGRSWIEVFARSGCQVKVFDHDDGQLARAIEWFERDVKDQRRRGVLRKKEARAWRERVSPAGSLEAALRGAGYVQESGPERLDLKQALFRELDRLAPRTAILGSSTSAIDMTEIARGLSGAGRCIVAHPVNPPHVVPAVEVLGGDRTTPRVVRRTIKFMRELGQVPILMNRFAPGFVLNRLQAALVREAVHLVATGVCDVQAVDDSIRAGLGLRWALMGPYGVANTNADGGLRDYFTRYRDSYQTLWASLSTDVRLDDQLVSQLGRQMDRVVTGSLEAQRAWRDRVVMAIRALKDADPPPVSRPRATTKKR